MAAIKCIHVGMPTTHSYGNGELATSIVKQKIDGPVKILKSGPEGNQPTNHTNAVYAFSAEDYTYWNEHLQLETPWEEGFLGENLTVTGINQDEINIGDILRMGTTVLQVSGVRIPCSTLLWRINQSKSFLPDFQSSRRSGFYLEVLEEGIITAGDEITHEPTSQASISVPDFARFFMQPKKSVEDLNKYLNIEGMGGQMLDSLTAELNARIDFDFAAKNRWEGWRDFVIADIIEECHDIKSFYLKPKDGKPIAGYRAGQFLNVQLPVTDDKGNHVVRSWSLSDYNSDLTHYRLSIKHITNGAGSGFMHAAKVGDEVKALAPSGGFFIERSETDKPIVLISAGIGITPLLSMLKSHSERKDKIPPALYFIHSTQNQNTQVLRKEVDEIESNNNEIKSYYIHTRPTENSVKGKDYHSSERLDIDHLQTILSNMVSWFSGAYVPVPPMYCRFYICGPEKFQNSIASNLKQLDVPDEQIHKESFNPTENNSALELPSSNVSFNNQGISKNANWKPSENLTLLELAENADLSPTFGCRKGSCGLCSTSITQGEVVYAKKPSINIPEGEVLLCCSRPKGDVQIDIT